MSGRGALTEQIISIAKKYLGVDDFTTAELRLMPYIQYVMMNEQRLDPRKLSVGERDILSTWRNNGWIEGDVSGMNISKKFWDAMNEILWLGYVNNE
jgi:hypothetical protein